MSQEVDLASLQAKYEDKEEKKEKGNGGMRFKDEVSLALISKQRGAVWDMIKSVGSNLMEGKDLISVSMPVYIFEPRSFLERMSDGWAYLPSELDRALLMTNPKERLVACFTAVFAGLHLKCAQAKPFNPILGETYQGVYPSGARLFIEQTSHHPPVTCWEMESGPQPQGAEGNTSAGKWKYYGSCQWKASLRGNTLKGGEIGKCFIEFHDPRDARHQLITFELPTVSMKGIVWGDRVADFCGEFTMSDQARGIKITGTFNPDAQTGASGFLKSLFVKQATPTDHYRGVLCTYNKEDGLGKTASEVGKNGKSGSVMVKASASESGVPQASDVPVEGTWLGWLSVGGVKVWEIEREKDKERQTLRESTVMPVEIALPSDCRYREDLIALKSGDLEKAQSEKIRLEELQRRDKKLRK